VLPHYLLVKSLLITGSDQDVDAPIFYQKKEDVDSPLLNVKKKSAQGSMDVGLIELLNNS
jgi:hypothetical protein